MSIEVFPDLCDNFSASGLVCSSLKIANGDLETALNYAEGDNSAEIEVKVESRHVYYPPVRFRFQ